MVTNIFTTIRQLVKNYLAIASFGMVIFISSITSCFDFPVWAFT